MNIDQKKELDLAFILAAEKGQDAIVSLLLKAGADIHASGDLALILAAETGQAETVRYLLHQGANVHAGEDAALRMAMKNSHREIAMFLQQWPGKEVFDTAEEEKWGKISECYAHKSGFGQKLVQEMIDNLNANVLAEKKKREVEESEKGIGKGTWKGPPPRP
ncbi:MAG TPA: ankyrin repeat domain-containing protein [Terriglobia bacterium]|nr:ankyrin repeat domain-containing protein [Terriglobia bacterium]